MKSWLRTFSIFMLLFTISMGANGQAPSLLWSDVFGPEAARDVVELPDGSFMVAGTSGGQYSTRIVTVDFSGSVLMDSTYAASTLGEVSALAPTADGNVVTAGLFEAAGDIDFYVTKISSAGNILWSQAFSFPNSVYDFGYDVIQTSDGGYLAVGRTTADFDSRPWYIKLDASGNLQWDTRPMIYSNAKADEVIEVSSGGYLVIGDMADPGGFGQIPFMSKIDGSGNTVWSYNSTDWGSFTSASLYDVIETADGGFIGVGGEVGPVSDDFWAIKVDANGSYEWHQNYGNTLWDAARSIVSDQNDGYMIAGYYYHPSASNHCDIMVINIDADGARLDSLIFGDPGVYETPSKMIATSDDNYFIVGNTNNTSFYMAYLLREAPVPDAVSITASVELPLLENFVDESAMARVDVNATDGYDPGLDIPKPAPPSSGYISVYFPHPEWNTILGPDFMEDIRNGNDDLTVDFKIWNFEVDTDQIGETVNLEFGNGFPAGVSVLLQVVETGQVIDLIATPNYSFTAGTEPTAFDLIVGNVDPPALAWIFPTTNDSLFEAGVPAQLEWTAVSGIGTATTTVSLSLTEGFSWQQIGSFTTDPGDMIWTPAPNTYTIYGLLELEVTDVIGQTSTLQTDIFRISPFDATVDVYNAWHMFSLPLEHATGVVDDMFGDDFSDPAFFFDYNATGYHVVDTLSFPNGYWLGNIGPATTLTLDGVPATPFSSMDLGTGWTMVGNGLPIDTPVDSLIISDGATTALYFADAVNAGLISAAVYGYDALGENYTLPSDFETWQGYWMYVTTPGLELVTYQPRWWTGPPLSPNGDNELDDESNWFIPIVLEQNGRTESISGFGVKEDASSEFDMAYDLPAPPGHPAGQVLRAVTEHPEWNSPVGDSFVREQTSPIELGESYVWTFTIQSSEEADVQVHFDGIDIQLPSDFQITATIGQQTWDLRESSIISVPGSIDTEIQIVVGMSSASAQESNQAGIPETFSISETWPNPFNSTVNVTLALPQASRATVEVYNLIGQRVTVLGNGSYDAGYHQVTWNATGFPAGVYFVRASTENGASAIRRVMYIK